MMLLASVYMAFGVCMHGFWHECAWLFGMLMFQLYVTVYVPLARHTLLFTLKGRFL